MGLIVARVNLSFLKASFVELLLVLRTSDFRGVTASQ